MAVIELGGLPERVSSLPGIEGLLGAAEGLPPLHLVGGAVRDLLLGQGSVDLDVAVEGDGPEAARAIACRLGGQCVEHGRFGTAKVVAPGISLDVAGTRTETYEAAGALPAVAPAGIDADLARRDFTVNAMAIGLSGEELGLLRDPHGGVRDLESGQIRVLHDASFRDDATRILRALRYEARLGFRLEPRTADLARAAAGAGLLETVAGSRLRDELLDLLREPAGPAAVARMGEFGIDVALHPGLRVDADLVASAALGSMETGADAGLAGLAALAARGPAELRQGLGRFLDRAGFRAGERNAVLRAAERSEGLAGALRADLRPSQLHALLSPEPPEALALALALGAPSGPVLAFVRDLAHVHLEIDGSDLLAAGVPEGPAVGRGLAAALARKLDGETAGRDDELAVALKAAA